jgi:hypothetical protein
VNLRQAKRQDLIDFSNDIGQPIWHTSCAGGLLRYNLGEFKCGTCNCIWKMKWILRVPEMDLSDRFSVVYPDDNSVYKLVEVTNGKAIYTKLERVIAKVELSFDEQLDLIFDSYINS